MPRPTQKILIDADVLIHFYKGEQLFLLPKIYTNKIIILDKVYDELRIVELKHFIDNLIKMKFLHDEALDNSSSEIKMEYFRLKRDFGPGESAVMAYCRFNNDVVASSNLRDIKTYCESNNIKYLTTMDFLAEAYRKGILNETECDYFIYNVKSKGSKLIQHINTIKDYIESI